MIKRERNTCQNRPLGFDAYRSDPLAVAAFSLSRCQCWKSWRFPIIMASLQAAFMGAGLLVYLARDGGIDIELLGGFSALLPVIFADLLLFLFGFRVYLYLSSKSGTIYQELFDRGVIGQGQLEDAKRIVRGSNSSAEAKQAHIACVLIAIVFTVVFVATFLWAVWWNPERDDLDRYGSTFVFVNLPIWSVGAYAIGIVCVRVLMTIWSLRKVFEIIDVTVQPLHPDKCGGLRPVRQYSLAISYVVAMLGFGLVVWYFAGSRSLQDGGLATDLTKLTGNFLLWLWLAVYVTMAPLTFFGTLGIAHGSMQRAKSRDLEDLSQRFNADYKLAQTAIKAPGSDVAVHVERLESIQKLYRMTESFPVWPFDLRSIRWFGAVISSPVIGAVVTIPLQFNF